MLQEQQVLQGRYKLKQQLGQNAGRQTWLADDLAVEPHQLVIVKLLAFSPQMQWEELKLFEREAQVLKHLEHPRIPRYRDYFSIEETDSELPWFGLVQECIPGSSLRQLLDGGQRFSEVQAQQIATEILNILVYLHELSPPVLHRDIKPSNLILSEDGQVYLVDFGAVQDRAKAEGATFTVVGTSGYAAPEQLWGRAVPASDLYALGATLIHLLTRTAPADLPQQNLRLQFADRVNLNSSFAYWLEKLIDPAIEQRFSSARQALEALKAAVSPKSSTEEANQPVSRAVILSGLAVLAAVVAGVSGIAFAIGSGFNAQANKAKEAEGKAYVGAMNRAQQAYYLEKETFSNSIEKLGLGIKTQTENYTYSIRVSTRRDSPAIVNGKTYNQVVFNYGIPRKDNLKSYVGYVGLRQDLPGSGEIMSQAILCESDSPGTDRPAEPTNQNDVLICGPGTSNISR